MNTETVLEQLQAQVRKLGVHVGLVRPEPKRSLPPLTEEERKARMSRLSALRTSWAKDGAKLLATFRKATAEKEEKQAVVEKARDVERAAFYAYSEAEDVFKAEESAILFELKQGAPDFLLQLCGEIDAMSQALARSRENFNTGGFYQRQVHERATYKRDSALAELRKVVATWTDTEDEAQLRARFDAELAKIPSIDAIVAEMSKPVPPPAQRHIDTGVPNPNIPASAKAAAEAMWSTGPRRSVSWN